MSEQAKQDFLCQLDQVWVEKRLFPARLLVLDIIDSCNDAENIVHCLLKELRSYQDSRQFEVAEDALGVDLAALIVRFEQQFGGDLGKGDSALSQFLIDFTNYGLREALAYIVDSASHWRLNISADLQQQFIDSYRAIATRFLDRIDEVKEMIIQRANNVSTDNRSNLDTLIIVDAMEYGHPWADGFPQHRQP